MIPARYADGRAALTQPVQCDVQPSGLHFEVDGKRMLWRYPDLARADDENGSIVLKRQQDTGERLIFGYAAKQLLQVQAPQLLHATARGVERPAVVVGLMAVAFSLAAAFLIGVPQLAGPVADAMPPQHRAQMSDIAWSQVGAFSDYCEGGDEAERILNTMAHRVMTAANVRQRDQIWITIVDTTLPNAFALPDDSIVVTSGLIALTENPDELAGVLAHEIAHIERNHVMKNVIRNIGAGIFFDVVFGGAGVGQAIAVASVNLAGLTYSRAYEEEADARGLDILQAASIDATALARLFDRLREQGFAEGELPTFLSSHPATPQRAAAARARAGGGASPSLNAADWAVVRAACAPAVSARDIAPAAPVAPAPGRAEEPLRRQPVTAPPRPPSGRESTGTPPARGPAQPPARPVNRKP